MPRVHRLSFLAMDTEIVDYTNENYSLGTQLHDSNSILFSMHPRVSSSESSQEMGAANFFVSVNMTRFVIQKTHMLSREESKCFQIRTIHRKWELPISL